MEDNSNNQVEGENIVLVVRKESEETSENNDKIPKLLQVRTYKYFTTY